MSTSYAPSLFKNSLPKGFNSYDISNVQDEKVYDSVASMVRDRYTRMSVVKYDYKSRIDGAIDLFDVSQEWIVDGENFGAPVRFPTLRDVKQSLVDKLMESPPEASIMTNDKNTVDYAIAMKAYIDSRKESLHEKQVKRRCIDDMVLLGNGFRGVMYHTVQKKVGKAKKPITCFSDCASFYMDPRYSFIDETVYRLHDVLELEGARDFIYVRQIPLSTFKKLFSGKPGFYNIENVQAYNWFTEDMGGDMSSSQSLRETLEKSPVSMVKVYEYMNQEQDYYALVANGYCIFEGTLTDVKGTSRIPVVQYSFEPRGDSVWATSLAELIAPHIWLEDTLINLEIMNLKLSLQPVLAVSGDFGFNPKVHELYPGAVWVAGGQRDGKVGDSITPIISGNSNTNFYNFYNLLQNRFSITTRSDLRNLETSGQTATQTMAQSRSYNSHTEQIEQINEIEAEGILTELMIEITQSFLSETDEDGNKKIVEVFDYVVNQGSGTSPKFIQKSGAHDYFTMTAEVLKQKYSVKVIDKRSEISNSAEKLGRLMQGIPVINNLAANSPEVQQHVSWVGLCDELMTALDMDMEKVTQKDVTKYMDEYKLIQEEITLGHFIDVPPEETRDESIKRMRFLMTLRINPETNLDSDYWKTLDTTGQQAWQYHLSKTLENITANQIAKMQTPQPQPGMAPTPPVPGMPGETPAIAQGMEAGLTPPSTPQPEWSTFQGPSSSVGLGQNVAP